MHANQKGSGRENQNFTKNKMFDISKDNYKATKLPKNPRITASKTPSLITAYPTWLCNRTKLS